MHRLQPGLFFPGPSVARSRCLHPRLSPIRCYIKSHTRVDSFASLPSSETLKSPLRVHLLCAAIVEGTAAAEASSPLKFTAVGPSPPALSSPSGPHHRQLRRALFISYRRSLDRRFRFRHQTRPPPPFRSTTPVSSLVVCARQDVLHDILI